MFLKYIDKIVNKIVYSEDLSVILMLADNIPIYYWDNNFIWYEYGSGISTTKCLSWRRCLYKENEKVFHMIKNKGKKFEIAYNITYDSKKRILIFYKIQFEIWKKMNQKILEIEKNLI